MDDILIGISKWMRPYVTEISLAIIATLMAIFGDSVSGWVKRQIKPYNLVVRVSIFILLVAFGYGMLTVLLSHVLRDFLAQLNGIYFSPVVVSSFVIIGLVAEQKKKV